LFAHKNKLIVSSVIIVLPMLAGLMLWNSLPAEMASHWGLDGAANSYAGRGFIVFGMPLLLLALHWLCLFFTFRDPGNKRQDRKAMGIVFWILPLTSVFVSAVFYTTAFGMEMHVVRIYMLLLGLMFFVIGNYLPKCRQNYTLGIRIKWTLQNEENWNATHRMGGRVWVVGGLVLMACAFLPYGIVPYAMFTILLLLVLVPLLYSWQYHKKQVKAGTATVVPSAKTPQQKVFTRIGLCVTVVILVIVAVTMFTGDMDVRYDESSFTLEADYWQDLTVDYAAITGVEYREDGVPGTRTNGYGSARLLMGTFHNEEFDSYTRYTYTQCPNAVVVTVGDAVLVLSGEDAENTRAIYEELQARVQ